VSFNGELKQSCLGRSQGHIPYRDSRNGCGLDHSEFWNLREE
jgi:hypothetical protein